MAIKLQGASCLEYKLATRPKTPVVHRREVEPFDIELSCRDDGVESLLDQINPRFLRATQKQCNICQALPYS